MLRAASTTTSATNSKVCSTKDSHISDMVFSEDAILLSLIERYDDE